MLLSCIFIGTGCYGSEASAPRIRGMCGGRLAVGEPTPVSTAGDGGDVDVIVPTLAAAIVDLDDVASDFVGVETTSFSRGEMMLDPRRAGIGYLKVEYDQDDTTQTVWSWYLLDVRETPPVGDSCRYSDTESCRETLGLFRN